LERSYHGLESCGAGHLSRSAMGSIAREYQATQVLDGWHLEIGWLISGAPRGRVKRGGIVGLCIDFVIAAGRSAQCARATGGRRVVSPEIVYRSAFLRGGAVGSSNQTSFLIISTRKQARTAIGIREGACHEENLSAESYQTAAKARISGAHEDPSGSRHPEATTFQGPQAPGGLGRIQISVTRRTGRFKPVDRILESRDFRRISREGRRTAAHDFVLILSASREDDGRRRLGVSVSRRVGNAVVRNYVKRCVREWFRRERERLPRSSDVVVIARRPAADLDSRQIAQALDELVARALRKAFTT